MTLPPLRAALALVVVLTAFGFAADPSAGGVPPDQRVPVSKIADYTKPQFERLAASAQNDDKKIQAVALTWKFFNDAMHDTRRVPSNAEFALKDVNKVGDNVALVLDVVAGYQKTLEAADVVRATDPNKADQMVAEGGRKVQQAVKTMGASIPMINHPSAAPAAGQPSGGSASQNRAPAAESPNLGAIATHAARMAYAHVGGGGSSNGAGAGTYFPAGTGGATPNGAAAPSPAPTVGDLLGDSDPNSPQDAIASAQERYRQGDIAGGMADASRAVNLGGGADALTLRGEMELDQKNLAAAHQDADQAVQLDSSNQAAVALLHFSETRDVARAPKALSLGGSEETGSGLPAILRNSSVGVIENAQLRSNGDELHRQIASALRLNDLGGALSLVNLGLSRDPGNPALLNLRATIEARQRDYDKSAADAKAGLALASGNTALLRTQTYALLRGKHYKEALSSADELIARDPKDAYGFALRAHAHGSMGDRDAMMADLDRAAALDPRFQQAAAGMAAMAQLPSNADMLFLFPGEGSAEAASPAAPAGRGRRFGVLAGLSALGGLLLVLGLFNAVATPLKGRLTSAFTRVETGAGARSETGPVKGLAPGLIRGQYEVSGQIGMGGMGMVFAGTDRSLGRPVAIKKMREELRVNPRERARFVIEAKTVAALHHPNIVDIYSIVEDGDDVYLIFEFVGGKTVHELVQLAGRLPAAEAARIRRAAADALGYAHSRGVIHRDMKPSNMMVDKDGRVKVMDFGIARMAKDTVMRQSMTNTVVGTPPYMAPEQEQGYVRRESDVYALAVCAYEMATGKLPFVGLGAGMLMNKINMSYIAPSRAIAGLPEALDEVFAKAFQADPDKRWRTPKEFADAFEAALPAAARA